MPPSKSNGTYISTTPIDYTMTNRSKTQQQRLQPQQQVVKHDRTDTTVALSSVVTPSTSADDTNSIGNSQPRQHQQHQQQPDMFVKTSLPLIPWTGAILAVCLYALAGFSNNVIARVTWSLANERGVNHFHPVLVDRGHDLVDSLSSYLSFPDKVLWLPDAFIFTNTAVTLLLTLAPYPHRFRLYKLFFTIWAILLGLRATLIGATVLPSPIKQCRVYGLPDLPHLTPETSFFSIDGSMYCNDQIFSGHSTINVLCFFFSLLSTWPVSYKVASGVFTFTALAVTLLTHDHYTVDILLAVYFTVLIVLLHRQEIRTAFRAGVTPVTSSTSTAASPTTAISSSTSPALSTSSPSSSSPTLTTNVLTSPSSQQRQQQQKPLFGDTKMNNNSSNISNNSNSTANAKAGKAGRYSPPTLSSSSPPTTFAGIAGLSSSRSSSQQNLPLASSSSSLSLSGEFSGGSLSGSSSSGCRSPRNIDDNDSVVYKSTI